jgi:hypothetical protein
MTSLSYLGRCFRVEQPTVQCRCEALSKPQAVRLSQQQYPGSSDAASERTGTAEETERAWIFPATLDTQQAAEVVKLGRNIPPRHNFPGGPGNGLRLMWHPHDVSPI